MLNPTRVHDSRCLLSVSASSFVHRRCSSNAGPNFGKIKGGRDATTAQMKIPVGEERKGREPWPANGNLQFTGSRSAFLHCTAVPSKKEIESRTRV